MRRSLGRYRHKITIQRDAGTRDAGGGLTSSWTTFATVYARMFTQSANNQLRKGQDAQLRNTVFECREWVSNVTADMRVSWNGRTFAISGVTDETDGNEQRMFLQCIEVPAGAS